MARVMECICAMMGIPKEVMAALPSAWLKKTTLAQEAIHIPKTIAPTYLQRS
jgi:hypothetical protein